MDRSEPTESSRIPPFCIREAAVEDLDSLLDLERLCWPEPLRATPDELRQRIARFGEGQRVIERAGRVVGAVYAQRIHDVAALSRHTFRTVSQLHQDDGRFLQLLAINVAPEEQYAGFGDHLLTAALSWARSRNDLDGIVAVSLCKNYAARTDIGLAEYITLRSEAGLLLDPILRFHELHGARIEGVIADYRPQDTANRGGGVLVRYQITPDSHAMRSDSGLRTRPDISDPGAVHKLVEAAVRAVLGKQGAASYAPHRAIMDLGLDSLDLYSLRSLLSEQLRQPITATDFFRYPSPAALGEYLHALITGQPPVVKEAGRSRATKEAPAGDGINRAAAAAAQASRATPTHTQQAADAIAVIGMACRFPGAPDLDAYWTLLQEGRDAIGKVPPGRWDAFLQNDPGSAAAAAGWRGGFLSAVDEFDAAFFHISEEEANALDPQQRILLELSRAALEHSGTRPESLGGSRTGIFVGLFTHDYEYLQIRHGAAAALGPYFSTGNSASLAAGRLAYVLGTHGPALTVDTACSSSLVAVRLACVSLLSGESDLALAAGVNLMLAPELFHCFSRAGMLSPRGRCATFSDAADGYVRGEGGGVLLLKRLRDAVADGDPIWGIVRGKAVNHDGASNGLTAPSGPAQERVIRAALADAGLQPRDITYVEAHGTGTTLGDAVELRALSEVFAPDRSTDHPLWLGSVKTNIGHTEAAAGVAGLIKVLLAMRHRTLPRQLHYATPSAEVDLEQIPARVPTTSQTWPSVPGVPLRAGVSSFGFSGTNAHVIVEEAPHAADTDGADTAELFVLSAKTHPSLERTAQQLRDHLRSAPAPRLRDLCTTLALGRSHFPQRLALVADSTAELSTQLTDALADSPRARSHGAPPKSAWLFSGQGSQYVGMGRSLYAHAPGFRAELDRCDALLREYLPQSLKTFLLQEDEQCEAAALIHRTDYTQPALFALEYALGRQWLSWGLRPDVVMGHSVGEYAAACLAEVFSVEDGLRLIAARGRLMQAEPQGGAMVAILGAEQTVLAGLREIGEAPDVAAYNGADHVVLSGRAELVGRAVDKFRALGIRCVPLQVSHAFHSALMEPMLAEFYAVARSIRLARPRLTLCSNLTGEIEDARLATPEYWVEHVRKPVRFRQSMVTLDRLGCAVFLEIGPKPVLVGMGQRCLPAGTAERTYLPSLNAGQDGHRQMLTSLGRLYTLGYEVDWPAVVAGRGGRRIPLPTYAFDRKRYWFTAALRTETPRLASAPAAESPPSLAHAAPPKASPHLHTEWFYETRWFPTAIGSTAAAGSSVALAEIFTHAVITAPTSDARSWAPLLAELEEQSKNFVIAALRALGFAPRGLFSTSELARDLGVAPRHLRLLDRFLQMLATTHIVAPENGGWRMLRTELPAPVSEDQAARLLARHPAARVEIELFTRCGATLPQILRGELDPLDLLFPDGDLTSASELYERGPAFAPASAAAARAVAAFLQSLPADRTLRVLEIGAGTGGTTAQVLPALRGRCHEYVFTDVTPFFAQRVQQRFADVPFVRFQVLDIERSPAAQGLPLGHFDLVLAANVVHATADLKKTLAHVRELLAPGGLMLLLEGSAKRLWIDLIFGLTEGWWQFTDTNLRPDYPLLAPQNWAHALTAMGWQEALGVSTSAEDAALFPQAIIAAKTPAAVAATPRADQTSHQHFLFLADRGGTARAVADRLTAGGHRCTLIYTNDAGSVGAPVTGHYVDPAAAEDFVRLLAALPPPQVIVHALGLDKNEPVAADPLVLKQELDRLDASLLHLLNALAAVERSSPPVLRVMTRGAHRLAGDRDTAPVKQTLWGLTQVLHKEHPELDARLLDLPADAAQDDVASITRWLLHQTSATPALTREPSVAYRSGQWFVPRLVRAAASAVAAPRLAAAATYLITGGFGGLGLSTARHLTALGARHLVLIGRRAPSAEASAALADLAAGGVELRCLQADVADRTALQRVFALIDSELPPLRGVIHSAGVIADRLLFGDAWSRFAQVLEAKVWGSVHLHELTRHRELSFFILYSSAMTAFPTAGQGSYVAANRFLDALAESRRAAGLPAVSIGWGPWEGLGMMKGLIPQMAQMQSFGLQTLCEEDALAALSLCIAEELGGRSALAPSLKFLQADFHAIAREVTEKSFLERLLPSSAAPAATVETQNLRARVLACAKEQRRTFLSEQVRNIAASLMGMTDPARLNPSLGLFQQGMDSLSSMALRVRLQDQLGLKLPSTIIFKYPTVKQLAEFLEQSLEPTPPAPPAAPSRLAESAVPTEVKRDFLTQPPLKPAGSAQPGQPAQEELEVESELALLEKLLMGDHV